jgi:hypothetical protein
MFSMARVHVLCNWPQYYVLVDVCHSTEPEAVPIRHLTQM